MSRTLTRAARAEEPRAAHKAQALLDASPDRAASALRETARVFEVPCEEGAGGPIVRLRIGTLTLSPAAQGVVLDLATDGPARLQILRDMVAERIGAEAGIGIAWAETAGGGLPGNMALARLESLERISPSYVRAVIAGPGLARFARGGLHFRLLFGPEGAGWPGTDAGGVTRWPGGMAAWHRPVYTTRAIEMLGGEAARITFDVFRHEGGRVTGWTERAAPGDEVALTGPGGGEQPEAGWLGLVGDETAVPVIARILADAPGETRGAAVLFVPEAGDIQALAHPKGVAVRWVIRGGAETPLDALRALEPPGADRYLLFAAERAEAVAAREILRGRGLGRGEFHGAAYWTAPGSAEE